MARCGGRVLADVAPGGGRHVFVLFAAALPWRELRDLARAIAFRFPAVDPAPMASLGGQISPPGSRHKSGGWRLLTMPPEDARAAAGRPNGAEVWAALLAEFAAELQQAERAPESHGDDRAFPELDDAGVPWIPRSGGRARLGAELDQVARTGRWDRSRYQGRSEARMAVLAAASARGWQLADVRAAVGSGAVAGAHDVVGASNLATVFGFAFASTVAGCNDYLTIQNPNGVIANVTIEYETPAGKTGLISIFDLANVGSAVHLLTEDLGVAEGAGFRLLGRAAGAELRGCSLVVEELR